ncbi:THAP domain-containing protein 1-like [Centruroides vittatus]|uniref:THAP domain-containing protein 1-like n=1 Tax=Centruroides vittatus TaxID=120091 RepID=UPI00350F854B
MPYKCCAPGCRTNYKGGPKLSVFSFPKNPELQSQWIRAICRENFVPTKYSKVCELHFHDHEIERTACDYDSKTGEKLTVTLNHPRLVEGAVPSKLPNCPKYLSDKKTAVAREAPSKRKERLENEALKATIQESVTSFNHYVNTTTFANFQEMKDKLYSNAERFPKEWIMISRENCISIVLLSDTQNVKVLCSVQINQELIVSVL